MDADPRDQIILRHAPLLPVPKFGELPELAINAHRYLVGAKNVFLEIRRPWLHATLPIGPVEDELFDIALPYGEVTPHCDFTFAWEDALQLVSRFIDEAEKASPREHAAWLVWNVERSALVYQPLVAIAASPGSIEYHAPKLAATESLAIDLHSHGHTAAFFSGTDDEDDHGAVKLAGVIGHLVGSAAAPTWQFRLCALGLFRQLELEHFMQCALCGCTERRACAEGCSWIRPNLCSACA